MKAKPLELLLLGCTCVILLHLNLKRIFLYPTAFLGIGSLVLFIIKKTKR